jgi:hypothetical protein
VVLISSHGPVRHLACPARFERATYALEAVKMRLNNTKNNGIKVLARGVAQVIAGYVKQIYELDQDLQVRLHQSQRYL